MTTPHPRCPISPRTEKRMIEKQKRREMMVNNQLEDKLHRQDQGMLLDHQFLGCFTDHASPVSPEKSAKRQKERAEDGGLKNLIKGVLGDFDDHARTQMTNVTNVNSRLHGISFQPSPTPSPTCSTKRFSDLKKKSRDLVTSSSRDLVTSSADGQVARLPPGDLRDRIVIKRSSLTHKPAKERAPESVLEFTPMPGTRGAGEEEKRKRMERRRFHHESSSSERQRTLSDHRHSSGERRKSSSKDRKHESRKRPLPGSADSESDVDTLTAGEVIKLKNIFNVMRSNSSAELSPARPAPRSVASSSASSTIPSSTRSVKKEYALSEDDEEELDLLHFQKCLQQEGRLPATLQQEGRLPVASPKQRRQHQHARSSSPKRVTSLSPKPRRGTSSSPKPVTSSSKRVTSSPRLPDVKVEVNSDSDIDSDQDYETFPISKSMIEKPAPEAPQTRSPETKPKIKEEPKPRLKAEPVERKEEVIVKPVVKPVVKKLEPKIEVDRKEHKPVVAVNPRMKNSSVNEEGSPEMNEILSEVRETPVTDNGTLVDIRRLISQGSPFNLVLSFGFDRLSTRSLQHPDLMTSVRSYRSSRGDPATESEEDGKPAEKPSCKVQCIPRSDHAVSRDRGSTPGGGVSSSPDQTTTDKREYGAFPSKRRRLTREPGEYDHQFPAHPYFTNGIPLAIPAGFAYLNLVQQPHNLMPPARTQCTFLSRNVVEEERQDLDKALKSLLKFEVYDQKGHVLKKEADGTHQNNYLKIKKYMESSIQYVYAALSAQQKNNPARCYTYLNMTGKLIEHCLLPRSLRGLDVRAQDKRLAALCLLLISHIQRTIWVSKKQEYHTLQRNCSEVLKQKQKEEQVRVNRSIDSSTPSPAGSLSSMSSYGTEVLDSGSSSSTTVPPRFIKDSSKISQISKALTSWLDYWEESGNMAQHSLAFFSELDEQVSPINSSTHLYAVARYVGQGLENLDKNQSLDS